MLTAAALTVALAAHAPVVVQDSHERFPLTSVADAPVRVPGAGRVRRAAVYGRVAPSRQRGAWLQYWLFYRGQDQDRGILRTGRHAGDWEMIQVRIDERRRPVEVVFAQHSGGERDPWRSVVHRGGHPVVYLAHGSHASYARPGVRDRTWPDPNDEADGRGAVVRGRLVRVSATSPRWMRWPHPWGDARARWFVPGEQSSPVGPAFQGQGRWNDPDGWAHAARTGRIGCVELGECDGRERLLAGGAALASLVAAAALGRAGRRRRPRRRGESRRRRPYREA